MVVLARLEGPSQMGRERNEHVNLCNVQDPTKESEKPKDERAKKSFYISLPSFIRKGGGSFRDIMVVLSFCQDCLWASLDQMTKGSS